MPVNEAIVKIRGKRARSERERERERGNGKRNGAGAWAEAEMERTGVSESGSSFSAFCASSNSSNSYNSRHPIPALYTNPHYPSSSGTSRGHIFQKSRGNSSIAPAPGVFFRFP